MSMLPEMAAVQLKFEVRFGTGFGVNNGAVRKTDLYSLYYELRLKKRQRSNKEAYNLLLRPRFVNKERKRMVHS